VIQFTIGPENWRMIRKSMPSGRGPMVGADFLEKIMLKKNRRGDDPTDHDLV
jgi:hypothetical protein